MKKKLFVALIILVAGGLALWSYGHATLNITVENSKNGSIELKAEGSKTASMHRLKDGHIKLTVPAKTYTVTIKGENASAFGLVTVKGHFLKKNNANFSAKTESKRSFVGYEVKDCSVYTDKLYSYSCGGQFSSVNIHVPATSTLPTYSQPARSPLDGILLGATKTKEGLVALVSQPDPEVEETPFLLFSLDNNLSPGKSRRIQGLNTTRNYKLQSYKEGFLIYDISFKTALYYPSLDSEPVVLEPVTPSKNTLTPVSLNVAEDKLIYLFSDPSLDRKSFSEVVVSDGGKTTKYDFDEKLTSANICSSQRLCVVSNNVFKVFGINESTPKFEYQIPDVSLMYKAPNSVLLVEKSGMVDFDVNNRQGHYSYTFGGSRYEGAFLGPDSYILNLLRNNKNFALLIENSSENDQIDKKVFGLEKDSNIRDISVYKNYIFISPNVGNRKYDSTTESFLYDPTAIKKANQGITEAVKKSGIDIQKYRVVNILDR